MLTARHRAIARDMATWGSDVTEAFWSVLTPTGKDGKFLVWDAEEFYRAYLEFKRNF